MNLSNTNGSLNASTIILDEEFEITIGQAWMPVVPLPILMLTSLSIFGCLIALVSSMQIVREKRKDLTLKFDENDEEAIYKPKTSSSSQNEYLRIDPNHPQIDPKRNHHAIRYENMKEQHIPDGASYPSSPPSTGKLPRRGPHQNTNTNRSATQISPSPLLQRDHHSPPQPPGSPSKYRRRPDGQVKARESSSAPMIMNGLWKRIERVLKMGFDADTNSCQLSFVHHNNNSALRPSCSDSASLPFKRPMVFQADCTPSLIDSSIVQLTSTSCQTETSSSTFPRKIACRCCLDRQTGKSPLQKSSSSSLLRNMYLKNNNIGLLNGSRHSSSLLSETSNPGKPKLSIHDEDVANKLCLSVDERIRRYRLCYSSSSDDDSDE